MTYDLTQSAVSVQTELNVIIVFVANCLSVAEGSACITSFLAERQTDSDTRLVAFFPGQPG